MSCPICGQKTLNCDCTATERNQFFSIEELESEIERLEAERRWIPVTERLPEVDSSILVAWSYEEDKEHAVSQAWYDRLGKFTNLEDMEFPGVTHWMPMPAGPTK